MSRGNAVYLLIFEFRFFCCLFVCLSVCHSFGSVSGRLSFWYCGNFLSLELSMFIGKRFLLQQLWGLRQ